MKRIQISLILFFVCFLLLVGPASAWLSGYTYRQGVDVQGSLSWTSGDKTNYPVRFNVSTNTSTSEKGNVFLNGHSNANLSDLRFTLTDDTVLDYFIETRNVQANNYTVWVEIPTIHNSSATSLYVYYGKADAPEVSSGNNTFPLMFDHFLTTGGWGTGISYAGGAGTFAVSDSVGVFTHSGGANGISWPSKTMLNGDSEVHFATNKTYGVSGTQLHLAIMDNSTAAYPWQDSIIYYGDDTYIYFSNGEATPRNSNAINFPYNRTWQFTIGTALSENNRAFRNDTMTHQKTGTGGTVSNEYLRVISHYGGIIGIDWMFVKPAVRYEPNSSNWVAETEVAGSSPITSFTSNVTSGYSPLAVQFNDTSITSPLTWNWSYLGTSGGNTTETIWSTTQNATGVFSTGDYKIYLNVTNASGYNKTSANYWVNATAPLITANFTGTPLTGLPGTTVNFTDTTESGGSPYIPDNWSWSFGDGNSSTSQNPSNIYGTSGTYNVSLTVYNASAGFDTETKTGYVKISDSGGLTGINRQDIMIDAIYTLSLTFKDAATSADIPVVNVTDSFNNTAVTTVGTAQFQYNYTAVAIYATASGYYGKTTSYIIDKDRSETIYLTPETATANVSSQTVTYYSPWQVRIRILDSYGVPLENATVTANYVASTLPSTDTSWLVSAYGVEPVTAAEMVNGSIAMTGVTDSNGGLSFTMFKSIQYTLAITNATAGVSATKTLYPTDQEYIIRVATSSQVAGANSLEAMQNTSLPVYVLNSTAYNLSAVYHDTSGRTSNVMFYVKWRNGTIIHQYDMGDPGTSAVSYNYTIINPGIGTEVIWMYNATRSGL